MLRIRDPLIHWDHVLMVDFDDEARFKVWIDELQESAKLIEKMGLYLFSKKQEQMIWDDQKDDWTFAPGYVTSIPVLLEYDPVRTIKSGWKTAKAEEEGWGEEEEKRFEKKVRAQAKHVKP